MLQSLRTPRRRDRMEFLRDGRVPPSYTEIEKTLTGKAELVAALKNAFAYCDAAYDSLTDDNAAQPALAGKSRSRFGMLNWKLRHTWERYGNLVVSPRIKGVVPPSSERAPK